MIISAYSERIYKNTLQDDFIAPMMRSLNDAKISLYSAMKKDPVLLQDVNTTAVSEKYGLNTYYSNMVIRKAKEAVSSNEELYSLQLAEKQDTIKELEETIADIEESIEFQRKLKKNCILHTKHPRHKETFIFPYRFYRNNNNAIVIMNVSTKEEFSLYDFEVHMQEKIQNLKFTLARKKDKLCRTKQQLSQLEKDGPHVSCFGSKKLFKSQHTLYEGDHDSWKSEWDLKRHRVITITGSKDHINGSMCARYDTLIQGLEIMLPDKQEVRSGKTYAKSEWRILPCTFKYRKDEFYQVLGTRQNISYEIDDHGDYYIVKAVFDMDPPERMNDYTGNGLVAVDINVDCFALTDMDADGNYLGSKVIPFDLDGLSSGQSDKVIEAAALEAYKYCSERKKPLAREDIKSIRFKDSGDKKTNKKLSQFAYNKMIDAIDRVMYKNGYAVFKVNPAFTSQMGKIKYMRRYGISIHQAAAYCIGRRALLSRDGKRYYEDMLQYKKFGSVKTISRAFKKMKRQWFYDIEKAGFPVKPDNFKSASAYVNAVKKQFAYQG